MLNPRNSVNVLFDLKFLSSFLVSVFATITGWQIQLEFWLKITSLVIGIVAGAYAIYRTHKKSS